MHPFDAVTFDHRIGEQPFAHLLDRIVIGVVVDIEFDHPADPDIAHAGIAETFERVVHRAALWIEDTGFETDENSNEHCGRAFRFAGGAFARAYAATAFARDMLSVADNLSRALAAIPADLRDDEKFKGLVVGLEATGRELESVFGRNGITKLESVGQPLDPNKHQAMMEVPSSDAEPGTILVEMQAGYMIKDRLLRPAMVSVAKKPD